MAGDQEPARDGDTIEEGMQRQTQQRGDSGRAGQPMGLLTEMEMGDEDMLREVYREVAEEDVQRGARPLLEYFGQNAEQSDCQHEPGAERQAGIDEAEAAPEMLHHRERTDHIAQRRGEAENERTQTSSRAMDSSVSRALSVGFSRTRSSR